MLLRQQLTLLLPGSVSASGRVPPLTRSSVSLVLIDQRRVTNELVGNSKTEEVMTGCQEAKRVARAATLTLSSQQQELVGGDGNVAFFRAANIGSS